MKQRIQERMLAVFSAFERFFLMSELFPKYNVTKNDGSPVDPNAQYFVLRIDTDPAARKAVLRYSSYISPIDPEFAEQLYQWVMQYEKDTTTND